MCTMKIIEFNYYFNDTKIDHNEILLTLNKMKLY